MKNAKFKMESIRFWTFDQILPFEICTLPFALKGNDL